MFPPVVQYDPHDLGSEAEARAEKKARDRFESENEASIVGWIMSSKRGRKFMWWLLSETQLWHSSFSPDAMQMAFAEGNRNVGLKLLDKIHAACPELEATMRKENKIERVDVDAERA